jgi:hypothetical protein
MIKKIIAGTILSAMTLFALPNNEVELVVLAKSAQKKAIIMSNMHLSGDVKEKFGKLFDEYQVELMKHRIKELTLIKNYAENINNLTDENANKLITEWATVEDSELVLKKNYIAKFKKIMPSADVIRYFQIENRLQLLREVQTSSAIPLAMPSAVQPIE